ncbi:hypothetical protein ACHAXR_011867 [Thalassiosira sp. AJA248-18]
MIPINPVDELLSHIIPSNSDDDNAKNNMSIVNRQVCASKPLAQGDVIGPSCGIPTDYVLDPVKVLACHPMAKAVLSVGGSPKLGASNSNGTRTDSTASCHEDSNDKLREEMVFWITLAEMGRKANERHQLKQQSQSDEVDENETTTTRENKRRKTNINSTTDEDQINNTVEHEESQLKQQEVIDAYLLALPKKGPDPCSWSTNERTNLLSCTPLLNQVENTLTKVQNEFVRVVSALAKNDVDIAKSEFREDDQKNKQQQLPPFSIDGRGIFPSVLWARSMHISRSFPRSLVDEEGVWWVGKKEYVPPPSASSSTNKEKACIGNDGSGVNGNGTEGDCTNESGSIFSITLGGYKAPEITIRQKEQDGEGTKQSTEDSYQPVKSAESSIHTTNKAATRPVTNKRPRSNLGIMIPLYDMLDHKTAHPVQWEAETITSDTRRCRMIRFRCVNPISSGEPIYNNYGPKGNGELLATYGFATKNNVMDSVEGIVLGLRVPSQDDQMHEVHKARMALIEEHSIPHRFEKEGSVLFLGPFSIMRKLSSIASEAGEDNYNEDCNSNDGVIPDNLYTALSLIGIEDVEEGPVVSQDELEMLSDVLRIKLDGFGNVGASRSLAESSTDLNHLVESVQAYKDGQRKLLQLALRELDELMPPEE